MFLKLLAIFLVLLGLAGLVLPIIPGVLLITAGTLLFFRDKTAEMRTLLPEKIPPVAALLYSWLAPRLFSPQYDLILSEIQLNGNKRALDIGAGPGILALGIAGKSPGSKVIGIDISEKMVEIAVENKEKASPSSAKGPDNIEFKIMDAKTLDFPNDSFDVVISTGSLHHWKDPLMVLNEIHRCLRVGSEAWIYDGYADASNDDINKNTRRILNTLPPCWLVRYILRIHGYAKAEYEGSVSEVVSKSKFKRVIFEQRGIMMRMKLVKYS